MYFAIITFFHILQVLFFINVYMVVFLFNTVIYVFLLLFMYSYCMFMYLHRASWHSSTSPTEVFPCLFLPAYNSQRRGTARTLPKICVLFYVLFVLCRSVYRLCKCVLYYCHRVATQLQLTNISSITPNSGFTSLLTSSGTSFFCVTYTLLRFQTQNVKRKAIPLQAWTGPDGSNRMRFPYSLLDFKTIST
jgi:hypothetical protein